MNFIVIGLLVRDALDRLGVCLNMSLVQRKKCHRVQTERQEVSGSRHQLDAVVSEAKRLMDIYHADDTSKISSDLDLISSHWQQLLDRWVS